MTLGEQIKQAREKKNYSQEELASKLDVSRQAISKWENDTSVPQGINREMLNQILDLSIEIEDGNNKIIDKYKKLMILGWGLAGIFAISTVILSVFLYHNKKIHYYLPQETVVEELSGDQVMTGTDSNSETVYIYQVDDMATEEEEGTHNYVPGSNESSDDENLDVNYVEDNGQYIVDGDMVFRYKTVLVGQQPSAQCPVQYVVLTNDPDITWEQVDKSLYSSSSEDWLPGTIIIGIKTLD